MSINKTRYAEALRRGKAYNSEEDWQRALHAFREALQVAPKAPEAYAGLGEACFGLKLLDRALDSYKLAARFSRGDLQYLERVADLQERLGQLQEAARTYMAAGELQLRQRKLEEAIYNWERAVRLDPGLLGAHRRLAMVHQRQENTRGAIREYLAIARILQDQGQRPQALQMCRAALRLDPGNEDALMAMRLVREGEEGLEKEGRRQAVDGGRRTADGGRQTVSRGRRTAEAPETSELPDKAEVPQVAEAPQMAEAPQVAEAPQMAEQTEEEREREEMTETVRQIATVFEQEGRQWRAAQASQEPLDALTLATRRAQDELAEEIFREEEGEADLYGIGPKGLSKLERDALIGQGIDFQSRGDTANTIACYEKAVAGGLRLAAAYFTLGLLYLKQGRQQRARAAFLRAGKDVSYREAIKLAMRG